MILVCCFGTKYSYFSEPRRCKGREGRLGWSL